MLLCVYDEAFREYGRALSQFGLPGASPQAAHATAQTPSPTAMSRKELNRLLLSANIGDDTRRPT